MNFHLTPNPEKSKGNIFGKILKTLNFWPLWTHFAGENFFLEKFGSDSFYIYISIMYYHAKSGKNEEQLPRKTLN